jgi:uncharacterized protein (DUF2141 family)
MTCYAQTYELRVQITNIKEIKGKARIAVFTEAAHFKKKVHPVDSAVYDIKSNSLAHTFRLDKGIYAVAVYQDENNDGQLNKRAMGIPVEGVGFSNSHKKELKPPEFKESSFRLQSDTIVQIPLFYDNKKP